MARMFLVRTFAILAALVLVLQTLDLLSESGNILAYPGNGEAQLWHYVGLRVPQIISRFLPFSVLLGTIITLATLNQNSEVIALKAAGLSAHQVLAPLIVASLGVAVLSLRLQRPDRRRARPRRSTSGRRSTTARCRSTAATAPTSGCATATI